VVHNNSIIVSIAFISPVVTNKISKVTNYTGFIYGDNI